MIWKIGSAWIIEPRPASSAGREQVIGRSSTKWNRPGSAGKTLPDVAARIKEWVLQASDANMELILRGLDLQIRASGEGVQIEGCVPVQVEEEDNLVTIAQTSA